MASEVSHVLLVDDDPAMRRLLARWMTSAGYAVALAENGVDAVAAIEESCPNFLVTDWEMPGGISGIELCQHVRRANLPQYIYTIVLTARTDADDFVKALKSGADDFTRKPVERTELLARLHAGSRIIELEHRLSSLANSDPLTGLASKRTFHEHVEREWRRASRYRNELSCVMLDIDFFKRINDTYGHSAGDEVIRAIGRVLIENCRSTDFVGRVGGEEFCVLLPETNEENAVAWAERVRARIAETTASFDGKRLGATVSLGVTQSTTATETAAQLIDDADQCLLAAKQAGRDRVISFGELRRISAACQDPKNAAGAIFAGVKARDVMTTIVAALPSDATVGKAAKYFLRFRYSSAPVVDAQGQLVGFLSEKDVMNVLLWPDCWTRKIAGIMKTNVVCYDEEEPILSIYEFLCRVPIRSVVIARNGVPTGIISRGTLLRWFSNLVVSRRIQGNPAEEIFVAPDHGQLALTATAISRQVYEIQAALEDNVDDVTPYVIGGASRIQELVNDLLAGAQRDVGAAGAQVVASSGWGSPCVDQPEACDLPAAEVEPA